MEIKDRIESCLTALDARRRQMAAFETRMGALITTLKASGETPGALGEVLGVLEAAMENYREIDLSCRAMIEGLREIGDHLDRIEDGRRKIVTGVETILKNLARLDEMAKQGLQIGASVQGRETGSPKRVLLIRIRPDEASSEPEAPRALRAVEPDEDPFAEEDVEPDAGVGGLTVH